MSVALSLLEVRPVSVIRDDRIELVVSADEADLILKAIENTREKRSAARDASLSLTYG